MIDIILILGLILVLGLFIAWPEISLYALALALPAIGWLFYVRDFIFPLVDLVALIALAAFLIRTTYYAFFKPQENKKLKWPLLLPFSIFIIANIISSLLAADPAYSLYYLARWPIFLYAAYIFLPYNLIKNGKTLRQAVAFIALSSLIVLVSGYLSLFNQSWQDSFFRLKSIVWFGVYPFGDNHNLIAEFLNVGTFFLLAAREWVKSERAKRIFILFFILTAFGVIMTFSRAGWITLLLQIAVYGAYKIHYRSKDKLNLVIAALGLIVILSPLLWKMNELQAKNTSSTENRWLMTEISLQAFAAKPFFGYGSGNFINLIDENIRFKAKYGSPIDSHGSLQKVLAESGAFGLAAFLFLLASLLKTTVSALKKYQRENPWLLPLFIGAWGGLFFQFFNTSYYKGKVWVPIAVLLAAMRLLETKYAKKN